jgi:hypothetical protein
MSDEQIYPQTYVKGASTKLVRNARDAVAAKFAGFKPASEVVTSAKPDRTEIQAAAKAAGVPANKSTDEIVEALVKADTESVTPDTVVDPIDDEDTATAKPSDLDQEPAPASPDSEGAKGSTEAPKPTPPGKSGTHSTR